MKTSIGKRLLSFLLAAVMVLGLAPVIATPKAEAAESDATEDYIDIPVEILDFRSDAMFFDSGKTNTPFTFTNFCWYRFRNEFPVKPEFPYPEKSENGSVVPGLIYDTLYNGNVVYTKEIVDYVALFLYKNYDLGVTPSGTMNRFIYDKRNEIAELNPNYDDEGFAATIAKCNPQVNGGELKWVDVKTYHDLAYYALSYRWAPVPDTDLDHIMGQDYLADGKTLHDATYNMLVPEITKMRLYKNAEGLYAYVSDQPSSYDNGIICNTGSGGTMSDPCFSPINNLGFEHPDLYGPNTEGQSANYPVARTNNYGFTVHAYGAFVYTEEKDLKFTFTGDDDVYFFINNKLVTDMGGMHAALTKTTDLNQLVKDGILSLTEGQICRFDMFHAERAVTGSNLNLITNIQIMDESVITEKTQYDPETNQPLMDGAVVPDETVIAYSFGLTNRRSLPIIDLKLTDSKLGVTLDGAGRNLILNDPSIQDITRSVTDLTVVYSGYNSSSQTVSTEPAQSLTFIELEKLIGDAVNNTDSASPLGSGVYSYKVESEENLLALLKLGLPASCKLTVMGFRHKMELGLYTNSLTTLCTPKKRVLTADGNFEIVLGDPINGVASCSCLGMSLDMIDVNDPYTVVLDYGKSVEVDLSSVSNTFDVPDGFELSYIGSTFSGAHGTVKTTEPINLILKNANQTTDTAGVLYTMTSAQKLCFTPKCFMEEITTLYAVYQVTAPASPDFEPYYIMKAVTFLPATMVYYEAESFMNELSYTEKRTTGADTEAPVTTIFDKWGQEGAANAIKEDGTDATDNQQEFRSIGSNYAYGNDGSYNDDTLLSNGKSLYVEGAGVIVPNATTNDNYTQIKFSFLGTGFDLISRTNPSQGYIRVSVYSDEAMTADNREKAITVNNYGELDLYQIPVVSIQDLHYGMHYVSVEVNDKVSIPTLNLSYGNQFYLDAIRIYDPIDVTGEVLTEDQALAYNAYCTDHEAHAVIKEVRESLLEGAKTEGLTGLTAGAMFVDTKAFTGSANGSSNSTGSSIQISDHLAASVATYEKVGPNNEVYLSPGQAIAFKLELADGKVPDRIDVGAKTIMGDKATLAAGFVGAAKTDSSTLESLTRIAENIATSTAMYYTLDIGKLSSDKDNYLVIYNAYSKEDYSAENPTNILSITDLKVAYKSDPAIESTAAEPYFFAVDNRTLEAAAVFMRAIPETPILDKSAEIMHSLNLSSDLSMNYVVSKTALEGCESFTMEVDIPIYEGNDKVGTEHISLPAVENGPYYYFTLTGITAVQMNDEIEAVLRWNQDGRSYYSSTDVYSVAKYAYSQLNKVDAMDSLKVLCADLLVYGAKAQIFKGYRLDALASSAMVEAQRAYCTDLDAVTFGTTNVTLNDLEEPSVAWVGKTLNLGSKVTLKFVFNISGYSGILDDLNLRVSYTDLDGKSVTATVQELENYNAAKGQYAFSFDGLLAAELRSVVSVQIYAGNEPVSCTLQYSADTYGNGKTGTLGTLCKALFAYSDSAKAYFQ